MPDGGRDRIPRRPLLGEAHDLFRRVYVNVYPSRVNLDPECYRRVAARGDRRPVGVVEAPVEVVSPHPAAVHRDRLAGAAALRHARERRVSTHLEGPRLVTDFPQCAGFGDAVNTGEPLQQAARSGQREVVSSTLRQAESDLRVGRGDVRQDLDDCRPLRPRTSQERPAGRDVVEQAVDQYGRSLRMRGGGDFCFAATLHRDLRARALAGRSGQGEGRNARDGGEGFAPEA